MARLIDAKWNGQFSCFDLVANLSEHSRTLVDVRGIEIGGSDFLVMAGPGSVESDDQLLRTAKRALTSTNIPWIFRLPEGTPLPEALRSLLAAIDQAGANRGKIRHVLASGADMGGGQV